MTPVVLLLFVVAGVLGEDKSPGSLYREIIRPDALDCQKELHATDDDVQILLDMNTDKFTEVAKCLAACVLEKLGFMKDGRLVPYDKNEEEYKVLDVEEGEVKKCGREAHEKFSGKKCLIAHSAVDCVLKKMFV